MQPSGYPRKAPPALSDSVCAMTFDERIAWLRSDTVGAAATIDGPYGRRRLVYADYTASGRAIRSIESYLLRLLEHYGNTHTEDDTTGALTTARLHAAEQSIKRLLNADEHYKLFTVETREKPGTPPILQTLRAALALELQDWVGPADIERRERDLVARVLTRLQRVAGVELVGNVDPGTPHRHCLVQHPPPGHRVPAPPIRRASHGRPVRRSGARRLLMRRALRPPPARHRLRSLAGLQGADP